MFEVTDALRKSFGLIKDKVPLNVLKKLSDKVASSYPDECLSSEEISRLEKNLELGEEDLTLILTTLYFIFSRAAYHKTKPSHIFSFLSSHLGEGIAEILTEVWSTYAASIVGRLKNSELMPGMTNVVWESSIAICSTNASRLKEPITTLQFTTEEKKHQISFTFEQLVSFYGELEKIQSKIDNLAS